jgi:epoxyqueuosine reductase QueG
VHRRLPDRCPRRPGNARRNALPVVLDAGAGELSTRYDRLFVPRNDARWLKRNALLAAGDVGGTAERAAVQQYLDGDDDMLREHAAWALAQMEERE